MSSEISHTFESTNTVDLVSVDDSKILRVSLYSGRAEITRLYKFNVKTGQNQVNISGLPNVMDTESLRVEGRGKATIHEVTTAMIPQPVVPTTSPELSVLLLKKERSQKALERCQKSLASLENYLHSLNVQHVDVTQLGHVMHNYDATGEQLDDKVLDLEKQLQDLEVQIQAERERLAGPQQNNKLRVKASVGIFAESEGEVDIALIYVVRTATWHAGYDIRVNMETKEKPVTLIYKAAITQSTGEDWTDVPLILETATPTFGVDLPNLHPWTLSFPQPQVVMSKKLRSASFAVSRDTRQISQAESDDDMGFGLFDSGPPGGMANRDLAVTSRGNVSATFSVPGAISIPGDGSSHNVTIVQLKLDAQMQWVSVPKQDVKVYLKAKIKNASEYTLLRGAASIYVDGSFISRSDVPAVSPQESFDCPLGLDPSVRITYHPLRKTVSQSGFYSKTSAYMYTQRITAGNTKTVSIDELKIIDQIPISEDAQIVVKLVSPELPLVSRSSGGTGSTSKIVQRQNASAPKVDVSAGVLAQWESSDEEPDLEALGKDGKLNWICKVPSQGKVNLTLQWEVTAPAKSNIIGLT